MKRIAVIILTLCVIFSQSELFASNYADTYGISAKSMGMANAVTATVNDWSSLWYNPAGLGRTYSLPRYDKIKSKKTSSSLKPVKGAKKQLESDDEEYDQEYFPAELAIVAMYTAPLMNMQIPRTGVYAGEELKFAMTTIGIVIDCNTLIKIPEPVSSARFGVALGTGMDGSLYKINDLSPLTHNYLLYGREAQRSIILTGLGMGFMEDLFGFGVGVNIQTKSEAKTKMEDVMMSPEVQNIQGQTKMTLKVSPYINAGLYVNPGVMLPVMKGFEFGVSYRQENAMEIYPFVAESQMLVAGMVLPLTTAIFEYYSPHIISTGFAYTMFDVTGSVNFDYEMWSRFNMGPGFKNGMIYYPIIPTVATEIPDTLYVKIPTMVDIIILRIGASWDMKQFLPNATLLCGYYFQPTFIPDSAVTGDFNFLDNDKHVLSIGGVYSIPKTWLLNGPVEFSFAYQYQYLAPRTVHKTRLQATTAEYNPDYTYGGNCHTVSMGAGIKI